MGEYFGDFEYLEHLNYELEKLYRGDNKDYLSQVNSDLVSGEHELQDRGIIEFSNVNGMIDRELYHIKDDEKRKLFSEIEIIDRTRRENEIQFDQILIVSGIVHKYLSDYYHPTRDYPGNTCGRFHYPSFVMY